MFVYIRIFLYLCIIRNYIINSFIFYIMEQKNSFAPSLIDSIIDSLHLSHSLYYVYQSVDGLVLTIEVIPSLVTVYEILSVRSLTDCYFQLAVNDGILCINFMF